MLKSSVCVCVRVSHIFLKDLLKESGLIILSGTLHLSNFCGFERTAVDMKNQGDVCCPKR